ncbi:MAG: alkaline phosphatase family protein [Bryobacterales bacterium]|nr:alkaline phosphatase family protein [Bryobacterales bacterium]
MRKQALFALAALATVCAAQAPPKDRHVIVISIDGFPAYALNDEWVAVPNLRALIKSGVAAQSMKPVNPTVTWPNHTSMVTGVLPAKHGVLYNGAPVRGAAGQPVKVEPFVPKPKLVRGTTIYDVAHKAGLTTAEVDWVAIQDAPTITWAFAEYGYPQRPVEREMIAAGLVTEKQMKEFRNLPIMLRDEIWTLAGEHIITKHKPNLLLFHLLTTDSLQHRYGSHTLAAYTALSHADAKVGRLIEATKKAGIYERTTFLIVSDHGFRTFDRRIAPNALLAEKGLDKVAYVIPEGGTAMVYVTQPEGKAQTIATLKQLFSTLEGVTRVIEPADFAAWGYPDPAQEPRMADLVLATTGSYSFSAATRDGAIQREPTGASPGAHGYLNDDTLMQAIFIASGRGIKRGVKLGNVSNLDVAPTIAHLLGVALPEADHKPLATILE